MADSVKDALVSAAHLINMRLPKEATPFTDTEVKGFMAMAYRDVARQLAEREVSGLRMEADLSITAGTTSIGPTTTPPLPDGFIFPLKLWEKPAGDVWHPMHKCLDHLPPNATQTDMLGVWFWQDQDILLVGATVDLSVRVHYIGRLTDILLPSDDIGLPDLVNPVAYLTASIALGGDQFYAHQGREALLGVSNLAAHAKQSTPFRRRRLRRPIRIGR